MRDERAAVGRLRRRNDDLSPPRGREVAEEDFIARWGGRVGEGWDDFALPAESIGGGAGQASGMPGRERPGWARREDGVNFDPAAFGFLGRLRFSSSCAPTLNPR